MELYISIIGALASIAVALFGAILAYKNSIKIELRKSKEDHYTSYIDALDALCQNNRGKQQTADYSTARNKLLLIANIETITCLLEFEEKAFGSESDLFNEYLTKLIRVIRKDLNIVDKKKLPTLNFTK